MIRKRRFNEAKVLLTAAGAAPVMFAAQRRKRFDESTAQVITGTVRQPYRDDQPGLSKRLAQLTANVDDMQAESTPRYGALAGPRSFSGSPGDRGHCEQCREDSGSARR
jgi:hypothetical protein